MLTARAAILNSSLRARLMNDCSLTAAASARSRAQASLTSEDSANSVTVRAKTGVGV
jgi:hypothetical protein